MIRKGRVVCVGLLLALGGSALAPGAEQAVFEMKQISPFDVGRKRPQLTLWRGQLEKCRTEPDERVKAYPKLTSSRPLYGSAVLGRRSYWDTSTGLRCAFVLDESGGTGKGHDRLYVDANGDGDLTKDGVLRPMKAPPKGVVPKWETRQLVCFDYLTVHLDFGPTLGKRLVRLLPRFSESESGYAAICFVATVAWQGSVRIGSEEYDALLAQPYLITGRFDAPGTSLDLKLLPPDRRRQRWRGADTLGGMRIVDGTWYCLSASPMGDKIVVRPYQGKFGVFEIGPGRRNLTKVSVSGSFSSESTSVPVGKANEHGGTDRVRQCRVPVGNYYPRSLGIEYGRLYVRVSNNYHSDGHSRDRRGRPPVYGIKIRQDTPFVLDFSNKPAVMFASPAKDQRFALGDEIAVKGVLTDPILDIMIRGLNDTTRKQQKTYKSSDGKTHSYETHLALDPKVTITNSRGKRVAEGVMPFG